MAKKPIAALMMHPVVMDELLRADHVQVLERSVELLSATPFEGISSLGTAAAGVEVLITSWGCPRIDQAAMDALPRLQLIAHIAGSVKGFVDETAWRRGVLVANAVAANAVPVAEYTFAAILFANKRIFHLNRFYVARRQNRAPWTREAPDAGNYRKTIGVVGASHVGRLVLEMLRSLDCRVLLYDPFVTPQASRKLNAAKVGLSELLSQSDVVSLHAPLLNETRHMIGARELALMANGATLINTARGGLVDQAALENELMNRRLYAVLDTTEPEVLPKSSPLYELPNVFLTPHIAGSLGREIQRLSDHIVGEVERFAKGESLKFLVKREQLARLA